MDPTPSPTPRLRRLLLLVVPLLAIVLAATLYLLGGRYVTTDNAYIKATTIPISTQLAGSVAQVMVQENQQVSAGQILFKLDTAPFQVALDRATAHLEQAKTEFAALQASYREKQAEIALTEVRLDYAKKEQRRQADLLAKQFVSSAAIDQARQETEVTAHQLASLKEDLQRIAANLGGSASAPLEHYPAYLSAEAERAQAELDLQRTEIRAPRSGAVSQPPQPGQYLAAGVTALALVADDDLWVEANYQETDLTYVQPGQRVAVAVDTYPGVQFSGEVESLSPATGAEFSVIPAQNATGNWVKIAQRLPVRIRLRLTPDLPRLRAGFSAEVKIDTGQRHHRLGSWL